MFAGSERFSVGQVAHHAIDWANCDKIERVSNEVCFFFASSAFLFPLD